ncbi:MAG: hypothetical protein AB8F95_17260 [Bacteroidia bacterium]
MTTHTWIYTLADTINNDQNEALKANFAAFLSQWKTHGTPVEGSISIQYDRFVIVQADPSDGRPSGCSIDSMRHGVEAILQQHNFTWLENGMIAFRNTEGAIEAVPFQQIAPLIESGKLGPDSTVFDNSLSHTDDLNLWERPLRDTWMKRFLAKTV